MQGPKYSEASENTDSAYEPQADSMRHDGVFSGLCPGVANSGNMAHRLGAEGDHSVAESPPSGLKGD